MRRRTFLSGIAAIPTLSMAQPLRDISLRASARVIVDNDFSGDPDGLIALAHQLLSPKARTVLITTSAIDGKLASLAGVDAAQSPQEAARLVRQLLGLLSLQHQPPVMAGADAAAEAIVAEALRDDPLPLVLTCGGPLTNVAAALRRHPGIARRMNLIWVGGVSAPEGGAEYNLSTDTAAARYVLEESDVPVWQIAEEEYKRFQASITELSGGFRDISPVSQWLYSQYLNLPPFVQFGGSLGFGDSAMVSLTAFDAELTPHTVRHVRTLLADGRYGAEIPGRQVRMYHGFDVRLNLADLMALLRSHKPRS